MERSIKSYGGRIVKVIKTTSNSKEGDEGYVERYFQSPNGHVTALIIVNERTDRYYTQINEGEEEKIYIYRKVFKTASVDDLQIIR